MKLDPTMRTLIESDQFDEIEDRWLTQLAEAPTDFEFFIPVLRALIRREQEQRASLLLQLLSDTQREAGELGRENDLLRRILPFWPEGAPVRRALVENLRLRYANAPNLDAVLQHFNPLESPDPLGTLERLEVWLRFDVGRAVYMERRGLGRVKDLNLPLDRLRVEFQNDGKLESFRPGEAERLLQPLAQGHFLYDKLEDIGRLQRLAEEDPGALLGHLFKSLDRKLTTPEVRELLGGIVPDERWNAWWKTVRGDRRLTVGSGTRPVCTWNDSASAAEDALIQEFEAAAPRDRLALARQHAERSPGLASTFAEGVARTAKEVVASDPSFALESTLFLEKLGAAGIQPAFAPADLLQADNAVEVIAEVQDRGARERALTLLRETNPSWPRLYVELLHRESDLRTLALLYESLGEDPDVQGNAVRETLAKPAHAPRFYLWLCREMLKRDELHSHANWPLLRKLLNTLHHDAFKSVRTNLRELFEAGALGEQITHSITVEQAEQLLMILDRDLGLEEHRKDVLRQVVWERFPELQKEDEETLFVTAEALESKRLEFEKLVREEIPRNTEEIRKAAAHGDLRENFEYKSARDRQEMLSSRAKSLHEDLRRARALDPAAIDPSVVRVGTRVRLEPEGNDLPARTITILGPWDSRPQENILSYLAPAVSPLLGKRAGEKIELADGVFTIAEIEVWR